MIPDVAQRLIQSLALVITSLLCCFVWQTDCHEGTITDGCRNQLK